MRAWRRRSAKRRALKRTIGVTVALAALLVASSAQAQLQRLFRADDGTAYQLLWLVSPSPGAETFHATTLAGSSFGISSCVDDVATMPGDPVSAVAGSLIPQLPYLTAMRTFLLTPNDALGQAAFDGSGSGRLTLGSGPGALNVCSTFDDCMGHGIVETLVALSSNQGNVPPACIAGTINSECDNTIQRAAFGTLAISFWPYMIPLSITIEEAAAPHSSLAFMFWGAGLFVFPLMLVYTVISYSVFRGKVRPTADHY